MNKYLKVLSLSPLKSVGCGEALSSQGRALFRRFRRPTPHFWSGGLRLGVAGCFAWTSLVLPLAQAHAQDHSLSSRYQHNEFATSPEDSAYFSPQRLRERMGKMEDWIQNQNARLAHLQGRGDFGASEEFSDQVRRYSAERFFVQGEMKDELEAKRAQTSRQLAQAGGFHFKQFKDGKREWYKNGKVQRVENEKIVQNGRELRRETLDMTYDTHGNLAGYRTETRDETGRVIGTSRWEGVYSAGRRQEARLLSFTENSWDALGNATRLDRTNIQWTSDGKKTLSYTDKETDAYGQVTRRDVSDSTYNSDGLITSYKEVSLFHTGETSTKIWSDGKYEKNAKDEWSLQSYKETVKDANGLQTGKEWGQAEYDGKGRLTRFTEKNTSTSGKTSTRQWEKGRYDDQGQLTSYQEKVTDDAGRTSFRGWEGGRYDENGRLVSYEERAVDMDGAASWRSWENGEYNAKNELIGFTERSIDARGQPNVRVWEGKEYEKGLLTHSYESNTDGRDRSSTKEWTGVYGEKDRLASFVETTIDVAGQTSSRAQEGLAYDALGRLTSYNETNIDSFGIESRQVWTAGSFDEEDRVTAYESREITAAGEQLRRRKNIAHTESGRIAGYDEELEVPGAGGTPLITLSHWSDAVYSAMGDLLSYRESTTNPVGESSSHQWTARYDSLGRTVSYVDERTGAAGPSVTVRWSASAFDAFDHVTNLTETMETDVAARVRTWSGAYDSRGLVMSSLETVRAPDGQTVTTHLTSAAYNQKGRLTDSSTNLFRSDMPGLLSEIKVAGQTYDDAGRVTGGSDVTHLTGRTPVGAIDLTITGGTANSSVVNGKLTSFEQTKIILGTDDRGQAVHVQDVTSVTLGQYGDRTDVTHHMAFNAQNEVVANKTTTNRQTHTVQDAQGRTLTATQATFDNATPEVVTIAQIKNTYGATGDMAVSIEDATDALGVRTVRTNEILGTDAAGRTSATRTTLTHPGMTVTEEVTEQSNMVYDALGRSSNSHEDSITTGPGLFSHSSLDRTLTYDGAGNVLMTRETGERNGADFENTMTNEVFDISGRAIAHHEQGWSADGGVTNNRRSGIGYNKYGQVDTYKDDGIVGGQYRINTHTALERDAYGRETKSLEEGLNEGGRYRYESQTLAFNSLGQPIQRSESGWKASEGNYSQNQTNIRYDVAGRQLEYDQTKTLESKTMVSHWASKGYDSHGASLGYMETGSITAGEGLGQVYTDEQTVGATNHLGQAVSYVAISAKTFTDGSTQTSTVNWSNGVYDKAGRLDGFFEDTTTVSVDADGTAKTARNARERHHTTHYDGAVVPTSESAAAIKGFTSGYTETVYKDGDPSNAERVEVTNTVYDNNGLFVESNTLRGKTDRFKDALRGLSSMLFGTEGPLSKTGQTLTRLFDLTEGLMERVGNWFEEAVAGGRDIVNRLLGLPTGSPTDNKSDRISAATLSNLTDALRKEIGTNQIYALPENLRPAVQSFGAMDEAPILTRRTATVYDAQGRALNWKEYSLTAASPTKPIYSEVNVTYKGTSSQLASYDAKTIDDEKVGHTYRDQFTHDAQGRESYREVNFEGDDIKLLDTTQGTEATISPQDATVGVGSGWNSLTVAQKTGLLDNIYTETVEVIGQVEFQIPSGTEYDAAGNLVNRYGRKVVRGNVISDFKNMIPWLDTAKDLRTQVEADVRKAMNPELNGAEDIVSSILGKQKQINGDISDILTQYPHLAEDLANAIQKVNDRKNDVAYYGPNGQLIADANAVIDPKKGTSFGIEMDSAGYGLRTDLESDGRVSIWYESDSGDYEMGTLSGSDSEAAEMVSRFDPDLAQAYRNRAICEERFKDDESSLKSATKDLEPFQKASDALKVFQSELAVCALELSQAQSSVIEVNQRIEKNVESALMDTGKNIETLTKALTNVRVVVGGQLLTFSADNAHKLFEDGEVLKSGSLLTLAGLSSSAKVCSSLSSEENFAQFSLSAPNKSSRITWKGDLILEGVQVNVSDVNKMRHMADRVALALIANKNGDSPSISGLTFEGDGQFSYTHAKNQTQDGFGRLTSQTNETLSIARRNEETSLSLTTQTTQAYRYDKLGNVVGYDRLTSEPGKNPTHEILNSAQYDAQGRQRTSTTEIEDETGSYTIEMTNEGYDANGRPINTQRVKTQGTSVTVTQEIVSPVADEWGHSLFTVTQNLATTLDAWIKNPKFDSAVGERSKGYIWNDGFNAAGEVTDSFRVTQKALGLEGSHFVFESNHFTYNSAEGGAERSRLATSVTKVLEMGRDAITGATLFKSYTDENTVTKYSDNSQALLQTTVHHENGGMTTTRDNAVRKYDDFGRLTETSTSTTDASGLVTQNHYKATAFDQAGRATAFERSSGHDGITTFSEKVSGAVYDVHGNLVGQDAKISEWDEDGKEVKNSTKSERGNTYNLFGQLTKSVSTATHTDSHGATITDTKETKYAYDLSGRAFKTTVTGQEINNGAIKPYNSIQEILSWDKNGRAARTRNSSVLDGVTTEKISLQDIQYDSKGRVISGRDLVHKTGEKLSQYTEDAMDVSAFDSWGRATKYTQTLVDGGLQTQSTISLTYDADGLVTSQTTNVLETSINPLVNHHVERTITQTGMKYDALGNLVDYTKEVKEGDLVSTFKPLLLEYDQFGRPTSVLERVTDTTGRDDIVGQVGSKYNSLGQIIESPGQSVTVKGTSKALDDYGNLEKVVAGIKAGAFRVDHDDEGKRLVESLGYSGIWVNQTTEPIGYDQQGRANHTYTVMNKVGWGTIDVPVTEVVFDQTVDKHDGWKYSASLEQRKQALQAQGYDVTGTTWEWEGSSKKHRYCRATITYNKKVDVVVSTQEVSKVDVKVFDALNRPMVQTVGTSLGGNTTTNNQFLTYNSKGQVAEIISTVTEEGKNADGSRLNRTYSQNQTFTYNTLGQSTKETTQTWGDSQSPLKIPTSVIGDIKYGAKGERLGWEESTSTNDSTVTDVRRISGATYDGLGRLSTYTAVSYERIGGVDKLKYVDHHVVNTYDNKGRLSRSVSRRDWGNKINLTVLSAEEAKIAADAADKTGQPGGGVAGLDEGWTSGSAVVVTTYQYSANGTSISGMKVTAEGTGTNTNSEVQAMGIHLTYTQSNIKYDSTGRATSYHLKTTQIEHYESFKQVQKGYRRKVASAWKTESVTTESDVQVLEFDGFGRQIHTVTTSQRNDVNQTWSQTDTVIKSFDEQGRAKDVKRTTDTRMTLPKSSGKLAGKFQKSLIGKAINLSLKIPLIAFGDRFASKMAQFGAMAAMGFEGAALVGGRDNWLGGQRIYSHNVVDQTMVYGANGQVDEEKTKAQTRTLENDSYMQGKNFGDKAMMVQDIAVAVVAAVISIVFPPMAVVMAAVLLVYNSMRQGISTHDLGLFGKNSDRGEQGKKNRQQFWTGVAMVAVAWLAGASQAAQAGKAAETAKNVATVANAANSATQATVTVQALSTAQKVGQAVKSAGQAVNSARNFISGVINTARGRILWQFATQIGAGAINGMDKKTFWKVVAITAVSAIVSGAFSSNAGAGQGTPPTQSELINQAAWVGAGKLITEVGTNFGPAKQRSTWTVAGGAVGSGSGDVTQTATSVGESMALMAYSKKNDAQGSTDVERYRQGMVMGAMGDLMGNALGMLGKIGLNPIAIAFSGFKVMANRVTLKAGAEVNVNRVMDPSSKTLGWAPEGTRAEVKTPTNIGGAKWESGTFVRKNGAWALEGEGTILTKRVGNFETTGDMVLKAGVTTGIDGNLKISSYDGISVGTRLRDLITNLEMAVGENNHLSLIPNQRVETTLMGQKITLSTDNDGQFTPGAKIPFVANGRKTSLDLIDLQPALAQGGWAMQLKGTVNGKEILLMENNSKWEQVEPTKAEFNNADSPLKVTTPSKPLVSPTKTKELIEKGIESLPLPMKDLFKQIAPYLPGNFKPGLFLKVDAGERDGILSSVFGKAMGSGDTGGATAAAMLGQMGRALPGGESVVLLAGAINTSLYGIGQDFTISGSGPTGSATAAVPPGMEGWGDGVTEKGRREGLESALQAHQLDLESKRGAKDFSPYLVDADRGLAMMKDGLAGNNYELTVRGELGARVSLALYENEKVMAALGAGAPEIQVYRETGAALREAARLVGQKGWENLQAGEIEYCHASSFVTVAGLLTASRNNVAQVDVASKGMSAGLDLVIAKEKVLDGMRKDIAAFKAGAMSQQTLAERVSIGVRKMGALLAKLPAAPFMAESLLKDLVLVVGGADLVDALSAEVRQERLGFAREQSELMKVAGHFTAGAVAAEKLRELSGKGSWTAADMKEYQRLVTVVGSENAVGLMGVVRTRLEGQGERINGLGFSAEEKLALRSRLDAMVQGVGQIKKNGEDLLGGSVNDPHLAAVFALGLQEAAAELYEKSNTVMEAISLQERVEETALTTAVVGSWGKEFWTTGWGHQAFQEAHALIRTALFDDFGRGDSLEMARLDKGLELVGVQGQLMSLFVETAGAGMVGRLVKAVGLVGEGSEAGRMAKLIGKIENHIGSGGRVVGRPTLMLAKAFSSLLGGYSALGNIKTLGKATGTAGGFGAAVSYLMAQGKATLGGKDEVFGIDLMGRSVVVKRHGWNSVLDWKETGKALGTGFVSGAGFIKYLPVSEALRVLWKGMPGASWALAKGAKWEKLSQQSVGTLAKQLAGPGKGRAAMGLFIKATEMGEGLVATHVVMTGTAKATVSVLKSAGLSQRDAQAWSETAANVAGAGAGFFKSWKGETARNIERLAAGNVRKGETLKLTFDETGDGLTEFLSAERLSRGELKTKGATLNVELNAEGAARSLTRKEFRQLLKGMTLETRKSVTTELRRQMDAIEGGNEKAKTTADALEKVAVSKEMKEQDLGRKQSLGERRLAELNKGEANGNMGKVVRSPEGAATSGGKRPAIDGAGTPRVAEGARPGPKVGGGKEEGLPKDIGKSESGRQKVGGSDAPERGGPAGSGTDGEKLQRIRGAGQAKYGAGQANIAESGRIRGEISELKARRSELRAEAATAREGARSLREGVKSGERSLAELSGKIADARRFVNKGGAGNVVVTMGGPKETLLSGSVTYDAVRTGMGPAGKTIGAIEGALPGNWGWGGKNNVRMIKADEATVLVAEVPKGVTDQFVLARAGESKADALVLVRETAKGIEDIKSFEVYDLAAIKGQDRVLTLAQLGGGAKDAHVVALPTMEAVHDRLQLHFSVNAKGNPPVISRATLGEAVASLGAALSVPAKAQGAIWKAAKESGVWMLEQHYGFVSPTMTDQDVNKPGIKIQNEQLQFKPQAGHYEIPVLTIEKPKPWPKPEARQRP